MTVTRADIAAVLSTVEGITGTATPPRSPAPGQGWPEWQQTTPYTLNGNEITWLVHVALPNGSPEATVLESDKITQDLMEALEDLGPIQSVQPTTIVVQQGGPNGLPCLTVTMTTV